MHKESIFTVVIMQCMQTYCLLCDEIKKNIWSLSYCLTVCIDIKMTGRLAVSFRALYCFDTVLCNQK